MGKIVITGASSGIGQALYEEFQEDVGWRASRSRHISKQDIIGVSRHGPDVGLDLSKSVEEQNPLIQGPISVLINCAGIMPFPENEDNQEEIFAVNFWGANDMIWYLYHRFEEGACIINIASNSGVRPDADTPIYCASKAALIALTKSYALKFAPKIRVNAISPGFYGRTNLVPGETPKELIERIPLGYEEDRYLLYPVVKLIIDTKYMTGANIVVDGGLSL